MGYQTRAAAAFDPGPRVAGIAGAFRLALSIKKEPGFDRQAIAQAFWRRRRMFGKPLEFGVNQNLDYKQNVGYGELGQECGGARDSETSTGTQQSQMNL